MDDGFVTGFVFVLGALLGVLLMLVIFGHDYQKGQTDCIQGKVKYELVVQSNGETKWEEKND